ncbi:zinc finger protein 184-like [Anopheles stephensi]|uniref:zinc finger protein 184-like n=1 Tax=Anopheles stephensi TaxID=30069 RepID=UPI0016588BCD|nr:zinc finger protein 184-like [Anopheles stephensi]
MSTILSGSGSKKCIICLQYAPTMVPLNTEVDIDGVTVNCEAMYAKFTGVQLETATLSKKRLLNLCLACLTQLNSCYLFQKQAIEAAERIFTTLPQLELHLTVDGDKLTCQYLNPQFEKTNEQTEISNYVEEKEIVTERTDLDQNYALSVKQSAAQESSQDEVEIELEEDVEAVEEFIDEGSHSIDADTQEDTEQHSEQTVPEESKPSCKECTHLQGNVVWFRKHFLRAHCQPKSGERYRCTVCLGQFKSIRSFTRHTRTHQGTKRYACQFCPKSFHYSHHLQAHERIHTKEKPFVCEMCSKAFISKERLNAHEETHGAERAFECEVCRATFKTRQNLYKHSLIKHDRPVAKFQSFRCNRCGKLMLSQSAVTYHKHHPCIASARQQPEQQRVTEQTVLHQGNTNHRKYPCDVCGLQFNQKIELNRHTLIHEGSRPYRCDVCDRSFRQKGTLTTHMRTHTDEKPYECTQCAARFRSAASRRSHFIRQHMPCCVPEQLLPLEMSTIPSGSGSKKCIICLQYAPTMVPLNTEVDIDGVTVNCEAMYAKFTGVQLETATLSKKRLLNLCLACLTQLNSCYLFQKQAIEAAARIFTTLPQLELHLTVDGDHLTCQYLNSHTEKTNEITNYVEEKEIVTERTDLDQNYALSVKQSAAQEPSQDEVERGLEEDVEAVEEFIDEGSHSIDADTQEDTEQHSEQTVPEESKPSCNECTHLQGNVVWFRKHFLRAHCQPKSGERYRCTVCLGQFKSIRSFTRHTRTHQGTKRYACQFCPKSFHYSHHLQAHERIHTKEKPFVCEMCSKAFISKERLNAHEETHGAERAFECEVCRATFKTRQNLYKHSLIKHDRPVAKFQSFRSNRCDKLMLSQSAVTYHKQHPCIASARQQPEQQRVTEQTVLHQGNTNHRKYPCDVCGLQFNQKIELNRHTLIHEGSRPYRCDVCDRSFRQKGTLTTHMRTHTDEKPYECTQCAARFRSAASRRSHFIRQHMP